jgi:large subunit ribosomal protein L21e
MFSLSKVNGRIIKKQLHVAVPHVRPSTCQKQIIERKKENERIKSEVRAGADRVLLKRYRI